MTEPKPYTLKLPMPPTMNNLFGHRPMGRVVKRYPTSEYKDWQKHADACIVRAKLPHFKGPIAVVHHLHPETNRRYDIDNFTKACHDALTRCGVIEDDSQIVEMLVRKRPQNVIPMVIMTIVEAPDDPLLTLTAAERKALYKIKSGPHIMGSRDRPTKSILSLVAKGVLVEIPGLLDDTIQGYRIADLT